MSRERIVSESIQIAAPPEQVFDLLADPSRHRLIDGSGMLRGTISGPQRLHQGARFGVNMRMVLPYRVTNTVVEYEENRRIAWQHAARHTWRYELQPTADGGTSVTESWDWSASPVARPMELVKLPARNTLAIRQSLQRLKQVLESG